MVVGPRGSLENHSIQCNGGPSSPSAPTERVVEFSHVVRLSEMFPLAEKNFISYALEITETFEGAVDLLMDSKENHLDQSEVSWKRLFLMYKNKMKIDGKERLSIVDRTKLFKECLTFYTVADKSMLRKEFTVEFSQKLVRCWCREGRNVCVIF